MNALAISLGMLIALILVAVALYFAWRQRLVMRSLENDLTLQRDHRRYLLRQTSRRLFGSFLMVVLAGLLVGALFLDYDPEKAEGALAPIIDETAKQSVRFIVSYWAAILLLLLAILVLAVFDLWATARFGFQQQKQLVQEHQSALEAELARLRHRRSELN